MKRIILMLVALTVTTLTTAVAFADEPDLKSAEGQKKFWEAQADNANGGGN